MSYQDQINNSNIGLGNLRSPSVQETLIQEKERLEKRLAEINQQIHYYQNLQQYQNKQP